MVDKVKYQIDILSKANRSSTIQSDKPFLYREFDSDVTLEQAKTASKNNNLDEVIFRFNGRLFVAYADEFKGKVAKGDRLILPDQLYGDIEFVDNEFDENWKGGILMGIPVVAGLALGGWIGVGLALAAAKTTGVVVMTGGSWALFGGFVGAGGSVLGSSLYGVMYGKELFGESEKEICDISKAIEQFSEQ